MNAFQQIVGVVRIRRFLSAQHRKLRRLKGELHIMETGMVTGMVKDDGRLAAIMSDLRVLSDRLRYLEALISSGDVLRAIAFVEDWKRMEADNANG